MRRWVGFCVMQAAVYCSSNHEGNQYRCENVGWSSG